jgi:lipopolysaccharide export system permease protein
LLASFIGPFAVSFGIALFVLVMQFLWLYIDEIAGKGVSIFIMLELMGYLSMSTFPMALADCRPDRFRDGDGQFGGALRIVEHEIAGVSLLRIMRSLIIWAAGMSVFSYVCSDFIIPIANLKFKSRFYDIRRKKPALTLEKGVFNEDFRQFVIRIGDKEKDGETIKDVMIEDQTNAGRVKFNQNLADSGQMYTTRQPRYFVMNLFNGAQYQEPTPQGKSSWATLSVCTYQL